MIFLLDVDICSDFVLATILTIVRRGLDLIQIVVPIVLLLAGTIQFIKLVLNPDNEKKGLKAFYNSIMAAVIVFFLPTVLTLILNMITNYGDVGIAEDGNLTVLNLTSCWNAATNTQKEMDSVRDNGGSNSSTISDEENDRIVRLNEGNSYSYGSIYEKNSSKNTESGVILINYAKQFIGNPYKYGGNSLTEGTDCSGFIHLVYQHFGIEVPRNSNDLRTVGIAVNSLEEARAGDIICYNDHVALYEGDGSKIIHARSPKLGIGESDNPRYKTIIAIRRVLTD